MTNMTNREALEVVQAELGGMCCTSMGCTECAVKRQALATLSALVERAEWQPIETAPRDGRFVLLVYMRNQPFTGRFVDGAWYDVEGFSRDPSHWMPLPSSPIPPVGEKP